MAAFDIRSVEEADRAEMAELLDRHWGSRHIFARGKACDASKLPGFIARSESSVVGLETLNFDSSGCEVVSLNAFEPGRGIGSMLLSSAENLARARGCQRLWLVTSNDNVDALAFYQKRGFRLLAVHRDAITEARKLKPQIPLVAENGIPIRDEIELEKSLEQSA